MRTSPVTSRSSQAHQERASLTVENGSLAEFSLTVSSNEAQRIPI